jgi:hypothetical protein
MLLHVITGGGLLLVMMGQHIRSESLFYYFRLEDQVPEDHLLRLIDKYVDFRFVRDRLKEHYSDTGRPSIDPELLLRILFNRVPVRHHQRAAPGAGGGHALGVSLVHRIGLRSGSAASLYVFQEPSRPFPRKPTSFESCSKRLLHAACKSVW